MAKRKITEHEQNSQDATLKPTNKVYYLVNPAGAVHSVTREHAQMRLRQTGWRIATTPETAAYNTRGVQSYDNPIAPPAALPLTAESDRAED